MRAKKNFIEFGNAIDISIPEEILPFQNTINASENISVYIYNQVYDEIKRHLHQDLRNERGGILIGYPFTNLQDKKRKFVYIKGQIPTKSENFSVGHFNVSPEELSRARNEMEERFPGLIAVGWYHSHPGHGVFLSGQDMQIAKSIYNADWQLAFVIDPLQGKEAFFYGSEGVRIKNFEVVDNIPACILAIEKYNQAQSKLQAGDKNALNEFRIWFTNNMSTRRETSHWFKEGKYQDLVLDDNVTNNLDTHQNNRTHDQEIENLIGEAMQFVDDNNFESLFPTINKIHQLVLDRQSADRMKDIMRAIHTRLNGNNWVRRK